MVWWTLNYIILHLKTGDNMNIRVPSHKLIFWKRENLLETPCCCCCLGFMNAKELQDQFKSDLRSDQDHLLEKWSVIRSRSLAWKVIYDQIKIMIWSVIIKWLAIRSWSQNTRSLVNSIPNKNSNKRIYPSL